ncbi:MAG: DUF2891 domain-containing protein [Bacteroidota bacterium]
MKSQDSTALLLTHEGAEWRLTEEGASHFAKLALSCIQQPYPYKPGHVINEAGDLQEPRRLHPAFYGCYDWHSAVHGHWMLVRLLKLYPEMPEADEIRKALAANLSRSNLLQETAYFHQKNRKSFERTYGWAWLLKLAQEVESWEDPLGQEIAKNLEPLTITIVERYQDFLPRQTYPIRTGVHPNTAFGLAFAWDYAAFRGLTEFQDLLEQTARAYFLEDNDCPASWEPGGSDFLSPCLQEADLMGRVLGPEGFAEWFEHFLPSLAKGKAHPLLTPAEVADRSDPQIVHLDGLNLSRAWCMRRISRQLPKKHPAIKKMKEAYEAHIQATLPHIASGDYVGTHWLASFAVYALDQH